jgi:hypothetical protein
MPFGELAQAAARSCKNVASADQADETSMARLRTIAMTEIPAVPKF